MANVLDHAKQVMAISALAEGNSIRSIERMLGVHRDTIMRLGVRVGEACARIMDEKMNGLESKRIEVDEIWGFVGKKKKNVREADPEGYGDAWTFIAVDSDTKLVASYRVGKRDTATATAFVDDLSLRLKNRIQLSSDGLAAYVDAVKAGFDSDGVDFAQVVKTYSVPESNTPASSRYSPGEVVEVTKVRVFGHPDMEAAGTSYVERQNLTLRMHCRRLTRLTNAFSKKLENFEAAVALNFVYYNFCLRHSTLRMTPAMAAGVANDFWTVEDLVEAAA